MKKRIFCMLVLAVAIVYGGAYADRIYLINGQILDGQIKLITPEKVEYIPNGESAISTVPWKEVKRVDYVESIEAPLDEKGTTEAIPPEEKVLPHAGESVDYTYNYPVLGITFPGTPAGGNFIIGYYFRWAGFHVSGGYWGDTMYGAQFNLLFNFYHSRNVLHSIALVGGFLHQQEIEPGYNDFSEKVSREFTYGGIAYNMNLRGFFLEVGIAGGKGDYSSPQLILQVGYLHRFNKL